MILVSNSRVDGKRLAQKINCRFCFVDEKTYPDSEKNLTTTDSFPKADLVYFKFNTINSFDDQLLNLLCILNQSANSKQTSLILPYFPYLRSTPPPDNEIDKLSFILKEIAARVKDIYLIFPHVNIEQIRKNAARKNIFIIDIDDQVIKYLKTLGNSLILVSPDKGFSKNITRLSQKSGFDYLVLNKKRMSATRVVVRADKQIENKIISAKNKEFIIIDDIISTGDTLMEASNYLKFCGVKKIKFVAIHDTSKNNRKGLRILSSNSLVHIRNSVHKVFNVEDGVAQMFIDTGIIDAAPPLLRRIRSAPRLKRRG